jgi:hypothetical protein
MFGVWILQPEMKNYVQYNQPPNKLQSWPLFVQSVPPGYVTIKVVNGTLTPKWALHHMTVGNFFAIITL